MYMKEDLRDTTFIIPIRIDSIIRLENLMMTVDCIQKSFNTSIVILEAAGYCNGIISSIVKNITYCFIEDKDLVFHKTKYLNLMALDVNTDIISIWDADVIIDAEQIKDSVYQIRKGNCDIAYPYNGEAMDTSDILRNHYFVHRDIEFLKKHKHKMQTIYSVEGVIGAVGGAVFAKAEKYREAGMDNEDFYGWGLEDGERHYRWLEFGYKMYRNGNCLFHLSHPRDLNGAFRSENHKKQAMYNFNEVVNYGQEELRNRFAK